MSSFAPPAAAAAASPTHDHSGDPDGATALDLTTAGAVRFGTTVNDVRLDKQAGKQLGVRTGDDAQYASAKLLNAVITGREELAALGGAPGTATANFLNVYGLSADKELYAKDDAGTVKLLSRHIEAKLSSAVSAWTVNWTRAFAATPIVVASSFDGGSTLLNTHIISRSTTQGLGRNMMGMGSHALTTADHVPTATQAMVVAMEPT